LDRISETGADVVCGGVVEIEPCCRILIWPDVLANSMACHPRATLQGAVTWRNQCRDRATLQGVRIPSAILKIVFRHLLFFCF